MRTFYLELLQQQNVITYFQLITVRMFKVIYLLVFFVNIDVIVCVSFK